MSSGAPHVVPVRVYLTIFALLLVLTAVTTAVAYADLGRLNVVIMLTIAMVKASLVALYFMHLRWSDRLSRLAVGAAIAWLLLMVGLTSADLVIRGPGH
jgi:cytochrome c oxidase subunit IV